MKILVIDQDESVAQFLRSKLNEVHYTIVYEPIKANAFEVLKRDVYDVVLIDPAPLQDSRSFVLEIRRVVTHYPYLLLLGAHLDRAQALKMGANDFLAKPLDYDALKMKLDNASRLLELLMHIGDDREDFPSAGGVIAKSAFNQLFLSAVDRADRYGEVNYVLFIAMSNYIDVLQMDGHYAAEYAVAKLSQYLVRLRRQSDIIGQVGKDRYGLLLQRPMYESEPIEAANRFAEALKNYGQVVGQSPPSVEMSVSLISLPVGEIIVKHQVSS